MKRTYDLEERLLAYSASIILLTDALPKTRSGNHIAGQLLRSGTSAYPNHGEAQSAESNKDFIHKMAICLKELRETLRWLNLIDKASLAKDAMILQTLRQETDELIRIFVKSIQTAKSK